MASAGVARARRRRKVVRVSHRSPAGARMRSSASSGRRSTRLAASAGSRPRARRRWWGGFSRSHSPSPTRWTGGGHAAALIARRSSTATASPSAADDQRADPLPPRLPPQPHPLTRPHRRRVRSVKRSIISQLSGRVSRTASRRRWASVRRNGRGPRCSRRTRFSSRAIVAAIFLVASHPASQDQHEEGQSVGHGSPRPFSRTIRDEPSRTLRPNTKCRPYDYNWPAWEFQNPHLSRFNQ